VEGTAVSGVGIGVAVVVDMLDACGVWNVVNGDGILESCLSLRFETSKGGRIYIPRLLMTVEDGQ
jgi:predicted small integral membrane protein